MYNLVIVGGGIAGLVAGLRAVELGLRVLLLEQGEGEDYPCNTRQSGGIFHIAFHDPFRRPEELLDVIRKVSEGQTKPELAEALATTGARLVTWLQSRSIKFMRFNQKEAYRWCMAPPRALRAGIDWRGKGPDVMLRKLARDFVQLGGELQLKCRVTSLIMEGGRCVGVEGVCEGESRSWRAENCLIADGGFQANKLLVQRHITPKFEALFQRGARTGRGDGLQMAEAAGAALTSLDRFYGHLLCDDAKHNDEVWPYPEIDALATAGIVVNESGTRIVDEGRTGVSLANELAPYAGTQRLFAVFDQEIWSGPGTSARIPANPLLERAGGTVMYAASVSELAEKMGVPAQALETTIHDYNRAIQDHELSSLNVPRSTAVQAYSIEKPPFMAIPICPGITYTMGGIDIDGTAQVLDRGGQPIPGLFAAGATTGGIEGGKNSAYIGGLIKAGSFGLLAAERVAALNGKTVILDGPIRSIEPAPKAELTDVASANQHSRGLGRFPVLNALVRYGKGVAVALATGVVILVLTLGNSLGWYALPLSAVLGAITLAIVLAGVEMVTMVTELLMPD